LISSCSTDASIFQQQRRQWGLFNYGEIKSPPIVMTTLNVMTNASDND